MNKRKWLLIALLAVALLLAALLALVFNQRQDAARRDCDTCASQTEDPQPVEELKRLTIGYVVRQQPPGQERSATDEETMRNRLGVQLEQKLGIPVQWLQLRDGDLLAAMQDKQIDIGLFHPFEIVQSDAIPLLQTLQSEQTARRTEFLVAAGSPLKSLGDLLDRPQLRWAFDSKNSDYGFLLPASQLIKQSENAKLPSFQQLETGQFDKAITAVLDGKADFATIREGGRAAMQSSHPYLEERTRVLAKTDPLPLEVLGMRPAIQEHWRTEVKSALLALSGEQNSRADLEYLLGCTGFAELNAEQYGNAQLVMKNIALLNEVLTRRE